jgi:drug/metabolite transporter (DMT)-like permease
MWTGVACALAAGVMWGLVFVGPLLLPEYPPALLSCGRYVAFGLIALPLAWLDRRALAQLTRADWIEALKLAAIGNLLYYLCLASAIQRAGGALPTVIIGTLPVVIAISANLRDHARDGRLPWRLLFAPLALIGAGIACVNHAQLHALAEQTGAGHAGLDQAGLDQAGLDLAGLDQAGLDPARYLSGALLACVAVACWTWYPLRNADWLRNHAGREPRTWATAQGIATLPLALAGYVVASFWLRAQGDTLPLPFGPRPQAFIALMAAIGLFASWLGTLCWNQASQRLPTAVCGQLIVFETLAALVYVFLWQGRWPSLPTAGGIALLLGGVLLGVRIKPRKVGPDSSRWATPG